MTSFRTSTSDGGRRISSALGIGSCISRAKMTTVPPVTRAAAARPNLRPDAAQSKGPGTDSIGIAPDGNDLSSALDRDMGIEEQPDLDVFEGGRYDGCGDGARDALLSVPLPFLAGEIERRIFEWDELELAADVIDAGISRDFYRQCMREVWAKCKAGGAKKLKFEDVRFSGSSYYMSLGLWTSCGLWTLMHTHNACCCTYS